MATDTATSSRHDVIAVTLAGVVTVAWYTPQLGFYSDDWAFLSRYVLSQDQSVRGLFDASFSAHHAMRPVQLWLCAALYAMFGLDPLGYHLVNAALIVLNPLLVYMVARELGVDRTIALAAAVVYATLPSYSTDRFWFVAFAITLSMTACLLSALAALKGTSQSGVRGVAWNALAVAATLVSGLSYEVALPLLTAIPLLILWRTRQPAIERAARRRVAIQAMAMLAVIVAIIAFKARTTVRLGASGGLGVQITDIARHALRIDVAPGAYGLNILEAVRVHFGDSGLWLPQRALDAAMHVPWAPRVFCGALGVGTLLYLLTTLRTRTWPTLSSWVRVILAGLVLCGLGYLIFLTNYNVQFTAAGIANRSAIVAALGAAVVLTGIAGTVSSLVTRARAYVFASIIALIASSGAVITNGIATHWIAAWRQEQGILATIERQVPRLPNDATLLLDGVCPYVGPAIVFESNWDLAGALQIRYRNPTVKADVVTPRLEVGDTGVTTSIYGQKVTYPYSSTLLVFDAATGTLHPLRNAVSARQYFAERTAAPTCPPGQEGIGVIDG